VDPKNQRPELWNLFNGRKKTLVNILGFPNGLLDEMDVWEYMKLENIDLPKSLLFFKRGCVVRDGVILANSEFIKLKQEKK
jgi:sulfate adenylyltransferase subunit 2